MYLSANKDLKKENLKLMETIKSRNKKKCQISKRKKRASNCSKLNQYKNGTNEI